MQDPLPHGEANPNEPDGASGERSGAPPQTQAGVAEADLPYAKPNLVLSDPDPYAFANRIRRLVVVFGLLAIIAAGPYLVGQFSYYWRYGRQQADYDIAGEHLSEAAFRMGDFNRASRLVADRVSPTVVRVSRESPRSRGRFMSQGSGVVIDEEGRIITNYHVVRGASGLLVTLDDGREAEADLLGADPATDLALLQVDLPNLTPIEWGDSEELQVGDMVWAVGSPFGLARTVTFGIVSATQRRSSNSAVRTSSVYQEYLQTDAAVNPGNSGGPLVNVEGKLVGINTAIVGDESFAGVSFAIPSNFTKRKIDQLREQGVIERGFLGVRPERVPKQVRAAMGLEAGVGVLVSSVEPGGPAARSGLEPGDVILRWNGQPATDPTLLSREIADTKIGSSASVLLRRLNGNSTKDIKLEVRVGESPLNLRVRQSR